MTADIISESPVNEILYHKVVNEIIYYIYRAHSPREPFWHLWRLLVENALDGTSYSVYLRKYSELMSYVWYDLLTKGDKFLQTAQRNKIHNK